MNTNKCGCAAEMCGCCEGIQILTPQDTANRPGLSALNYRVGTHGAFLETMKARLTTMTVDVMGADGQTATLRPLLDLTTRDPGDFSIALLDGWATVADVLTFYQERIANEGYLRTATERRSILELARLTGYALRPGVAASVYLAYTLDEDRSATPPKPSATTIPKGSRSQSVPGPGELPQTFETSADLEARSEWNNLPVRMSQPQTLTSIKNVADSKTGPHIFLQGTNTNLNPNDALLIDFGDGQPEPMRVLKVSPDTKNNRTEILFQSWTTETKQQLEKKLSGVRAQREIASQMPAERLDVFAKSESLNVTNLLNSLLKAPSQSPANSLQLGRSAANLATSGADFGSRLLVAQHPELAGTLYPALSHALVPRQNQIRVYALRQKASLFGHNAPFKPTRLGTDNFQLVEWSSDDMQAASEADLTDFTSSPTSNTLYLDASYDKIQVDQPSTPGWILIDSSAAAMNAFASFKPLAQPPLVATVDNVQADISRAVYGITGKTTRLKISADWIQFVTAPEPQIGAPRAFVIENGNDFQIIRRTLVYAQSEELSLAEVPIETPLGTCSTSDAMAGAHLELDGLYDGLDSGRWLIVSGERNLPNVSGVVASELVMLAEVTHPPALAGDKIHTLLRLAAPLAYCYKRDTVTVYGNVVNATHGETRREVLGSGDGAQTLQSFTLKQPPLTFVSAPNPAGVDSTLDLFVNNVHWHETDSLGALGPKDRQFITKTDDAGKTTVIFGNGKQGARLPTGIQNVTAVYRNGIGKPGNVNAEQISLLQSRPLYVKSVINPLPATGGADKEALDQARENAPLTVMSLDRLVSVQDYADFTRTFAGIGKAAARKLSDTKRQLVHLTIAGADDIPIAESSDLYQNLLAALRGYGDADMPVTVQLRELVTLMLSAKVRIATDYQWEPVVTKIRATLLDEFGFQKRALGQPVLLSEIISVIQNTEGVAYVDVDAFGGIAEQLSLDGISKAAQIIVKTIVNKLPPPPRVDANLADFENGTLLPAQLAIFTDAVPDTLILNELK